ncbi:hypothetical protein [Leisingera sp. HS039]|uniref:hypothetical protein n=1 Tax=Leisingera sp. HS039 TaxID=2818496 RepID=UPI0032B4B3E1
MGAEVARARPLHGGNLSEVQLLELTDSRRVVAKTVTLVAAEAAMLPAICAAGAPAPELLGAAPPASRSRRPAPGSAIAV